MNRQFPRLNYAEAIGREGGVSGDVGEGEVGSLRTPHPQLLIAGMRFKFYNSD